jgi:hypothetical protein
MTIILSIDEARRYNVHGDRDNVDREKISTLRTSPTVPIMMNRVMITLVSSIEISESIFLVCE